ncbi:MAG: hypothetical protein A2W68_11550 [Betaproteobacteria bacterium RIFCSPLOWO2_02_64_14]|nr:MAG: hypothetical protein A2W68_11550 [Betaproteobacteria bacterium RIFCSPLOWO2_02_64_14]
MDHGPLVDYRWPVDGWALVDRAPMHRWRACGRARFDMASRTGSDRAAGGRSLEALSGRIAVPVTDERSWAGAVAFRECGERSRNCCTDTQHAKGFPGVHGILLFCGCLLTTTPGRR